MYISFEAFFLMIQEGFIMPLKKNELTKEMLEKAMQCKNAEELTALAKMGGLRTHKRRSGRLFGRTV